MAVYCKLYHWPISQAPNFPEWAWWSNANFTTGQYLKHPTLQNEHGGVMQTSLLIDFTHVIRFLRDAKRQPCWFLASIVLPIPACKQFCSFIAFCLSPVNGVMHAKHGRGASRLRAISSLWRKGSIWAKNIGNWGTGWRRPRESENGVSGAHVHRCVGMARDEVRLFCSFPRLLHLYHIQRFWLV